MAAAREVPEGNSDEGGAAAGYLTLLRRLDRVRALGVTLGLDRVHAALDRVGRPDRRFLSVQIAGTNGKGSTAAMTEAILRAAGLRTGLYTSPHLSRFTERVRVDGREVDGDRLAALDGPLAATGIPLTYFEVATVLALGAFAEAGVEVAVLETGLGGRLDATTAVTPVATAITGIADDHADMLGPTLTHIAREKAGIAKPGVPLFLGPLAPALDAVIAADAASVGVSAIARYGRDFGAPDAPLALAGAHQRVNAALAVALARAAASSSSSPVTSAARPRTLSEGAIAEGLAGVRWPGRLERIGDVLLDCAHNVEGATALAHALDAGRGHERDSAGGASVAATSRAGRRALVVSVVAGKDAAGILAALAPRVDAIVLTSSPSERALPAEALRALVPPGGPPARVVADPAAALAAARAEAGAGGLVVVAGSIFLVGLLRAALLGEPRDPLLTSDPLPRPPPEKTGVLR